MGAHLAYIFAQLVNSGEGVCVYCAPSNKAVDVVHGIIMECCDTTLCNNNRSPF